MYVGHIINLGTYFRELDKRIFGQGTIVKFWSLDF
jgi:hypothetical protein